MAYSQQKRITEKGRLLDEKGFLSHWGWSTQLMSEYDRTDIQSINLLRIKEWDSYFFGDDRWQYSISLADNSIAGIFSVTASDLLKKRSVTFHSSELFTVGGFEMPSSSTFGDIVYRSKKASLNVSLGQNERRLTVRIPNFDDVRELYISAVFTLPHEDSLSVVLPFKNRSEFCYTHTIGCLPVSATVRYSGIETHFESSNTFGFYHWSRGVLPSSSKWLRCSASTLYEGERFGFNLEEGFGDRSECGGNAFFYKGEVFKTGELHITVPDDSLKEPWTLIGEDGDINLRLVPFHTEDCALSCALFSKMRRHRVFCRYFGTVMLRSESGEVYRLVLNGIPGQAERVDCKW